MMVFAKKFVSGQQNFVEQNPDRFFPILPNFFEKISFFIQSNIKNLNVMKPIFVPQKKIKIPMKSQQTGGLNDSNIILTQQTM